MKRSPRTPSGATGKVEKVYLAGWPNRVIKSALATIFPHDPILP
jgi:hypothetical protein